MARQITSTQNPYIKNVALLVHKARERRPRGLFVAEGFREVELALRNGFRAEALFFDEGLTDESRIEELAALAGEPRPELIRVNKAVFEKIAYRTSVANVVGLFQLRERTFNDIRLTHAPLLLVVEHVEKPGNLGAMLRTADAAGVHGVIVCDPRTDIFNPNTIRASLGAVFSVPVVATDNETTLQWLRQNHIRVIATSLEASRPLYDCDLTKPTALVLGAESEGISEFWQQHADERVIIPMSGQVDSLNVSASAAVVLFEAVRQRRSNTRG